MMIDDQNGSMAMTIMMTHDITVLEMNGGPPGLCDLYFLNIISRNHLFSVSPFLIDCVLGIHQPGRDSSEKSAKNAWSKEGNVAETDQASEGNRRSVPWISSRRPWIHSTIGQTICEIWRQHQNQSGKGEWHDIEEHQTDNRRKLRVLLPKKWSEKKRIEIKQLTLLVHSRYGYYNNQNNNNGYYFSKPKYQLYPYSQHDIPPTGDGYQSQEAHGHYAHAGAHQHDYAQPQRLHTTVEIQRSHGYELKPEDSEYRTIFEEDEYRQYLQRQRDYQHGQHQHGGGGYEGADGPVIVLRVPGPAKYAAHLQALLQQYLELRAAQYIQALQEQEAHGHHSQQYSEPDLTSAYHQPDPNAHKYSQQVYGTHLFQANNEDHSGQAQADEPEHGHQHQSLQEAPIVYQHEGDIDQEQQYQSGYAYQPEEKHVEAAQEAPHAGYTYDAPSHGHGHLLTTENFPDHKHTQVIFKHPTQQPQEYHHHHDDDEQQHQLQQHDAHAAHVAHAAHAEHAAHAAHAVHAAAQGNDDTTATDAVEPNVQTYQAPLVYHQLEQYYGEEQEFLPSSGEPHGYLPADHSAHAVQQPTEHNYVTITQRPHAAPYNYHAHPVQHDESGGDDYATPATIRTRSSKRQAHFTEEQMKKFSALMDRMKKKLTAIHENEDAAADANEKR